MLIYIILILLLIINSKAVLLGANYGLYLWYSNVIPALLPFIIVSSYLTADILSNNAANSINNYKTSNKKIYFNIFLMGLLCGCPIGAKTISSYVSYGKINKNIGNNLLPLCNNLSPMFISGLISYKLLNNKIPLLIIFFCLYAPQFLIFTIRFFHFKYKSHNTLNANNPTYNKNILSQKSFSSDNALLSSIIQITYIGIYIMLCSIIISIINSSTILPNELKTVISSITEVTYGMTKLSQINYISNTKKIALILSVASFGGISSILQTNKAIEKSGLSIIQYIIFKIIGATLTYVATYLLI